MLTLSAIEAQWLLAGIALAYAGAFFAGALHELHAWWRGRR
jgi:hypothetical protein